MKNLIIIIVILFVMGVINASVNHMTGLSIEGPIWAQMIHYMMHFATGFIVCLVSTGSIITYLTLFPLFGRISSNYPVLNSSKSELSQNQKEFEELQDVLKSAELALHYSKHSDFGKPDLLINRIKEMRLRCLLGKKQ